MAPAKQRVHLHIVAWVVVGAVLLASSLACAQSPSPFAVETNLHGVYAFPQAPAGFDPMTASAAELGRYGYPSQPAVSESAKAFARWASTVNSGLTRVVPQLVRTNIYHRPAADVAVRSSRNATSSNWSGYVLVKNKVALSNVTGAWIVPAVQQAFGTCSGEWDYSSQWVGIDGFKNSPRLFQSGSEANAKCAGGTTSTEYYPWVEWLPGPEFELLDSNGSALPFAQGDYLIVMVTATHWSRGKSSKSSNGNLVFTDVTQNWQTSLAFTAAALHGSSVAGQSAEWVIEDPDVGGSLGTLANYVVDPWFEASANDLGNKPHMPGSPKGTSAYAITMLDSASPISYAKLFGTDTLWFFDENSAL